MVVIIGEMIVMRKNGGSFVKTGEEVRKPLKIDQGTPAAGSGAEGGKAGGGVFLEVDTAGSKQLKLYLVQASESQGPQRLHPEPSPSPSLGLPKGSCSTALLTLYTTS